VADEFEREAVLAYAEKLAGDLREVGELLGHAVATFQATVQDFQTWVEDGRAASSETEGLTASSSQGPAVALVPEPAAEADQRSGLDRRSGENRRVFVADGLAARIFRSLDRREGAERRSGVERRHGRSRSAPTRARWSASPGSAGAVPRSDR
jgi:hypothetical protein